MADKVQILKQYDIFDREEALMTLFMERGPKFLCKYLGVASINSPEWQIIFDYLVLEKNVFFALSKRYYEQFAELYESNGPAKMRETLAIKLKKYDFIWQPIHDMIGIAEGALIKFVFNSRFGLSEELRIYGAERVREKLQIDHARYNETWGQILDVLLEHQVNSYIASTSNDRFMDVFVAQMNLRRPHSKV